MNLAEEIKRKAHQLGFDLVGITDALPIEPEHVNHLAEWLRSGFAGQMGYMRKNLEKRIDPARLLPNARSVICTGLNYKPPKAFKGSGTFFGPPKAVTKNVPDPLPLGRVANFALYEDYHFFMKKRLYKLVEFIKSVTKEDFGFKVCVDSAPVAERALAVRAGLGFIGKNHMLINPELGPQILLGEIITTLGIQTDEPSNGGCASCGRCIAACPTGALRSDGRFDAGRCISYLTIEYKGQVPAELAEKIGGWLFGCDECVLVCPFADKSAVCGNKQFKLYGNADRLNLNEVLSLSPESFKDKFTDSAFKHSGLERLKRNARICLANSHRQKT